MRRLLIPIAVVALSFVAGVAVAGRPTSIISDVSVDDIQVVDTTAVPMVPAMSTTDPAG